MIISAHFRIINKFDFKTIFLLCRFCLHLALLWLAGQSDDWRKYRRCFYKATHTETVAYWYNSYANLKHLNRTCRLLPFRLELPSVISISVKNTVVGLCMNDYYLLKNGYWPLICYENIDKKFLNRLTRKKR